MVQTDTMLQKGYSTYQNIASQKWQHTQMGLHKNDISKLTLLVFWSATHDHECESYIKFKNSLLKITQLSHWQITFGHFFTRCVILVRHNFLWKPYLSISGGVFVMCHFYKMPLFSKSIKGCFFSGCHFCWVYLMVLFLFLYSYVHKECFLELSNCNYLLFYW